MSVSLRNTKQMLMNKCRRYGSDIKPLRKSKKRRFRRNSRRNR